MNPVDVERAVDYVARAKDVAKIADRFADEGDRAGRLSQPVVEALHREGLLGMWVPRSVRGGLELDPAVVAPGHRERVVRRSVGRAGC